MMTFRRFLEEKFNRYSVASQARQKAVSDRLEILRKPEKSEEDYKQSMRLVNREIRAAELSAAASGKFETPKNKTRKWHLARAKGARKREKE